MQIHARKGCWTENNKIHFRVWQSTQRGIIYRKARVNACRVVKECPCVQCGESKQRLKTSLVLFEKDLRRLFFTMNNNENE